MKDLFSALPKLLKTIPNSSEVRRAVLFAAWRRAAGPQLNEHTEPCGIDHERLIVAVADRNWKRQLGGLAPQLIFKINAALGGAYVRYIDFVVDPVAVESGRAERGQGRIAVDVGEPSPELNESAGAIKDESLRREFLRAAAGSLAHNRKYGR